MFLHIRLEVKKKNEEERNHCDLYTAANFVTLFKPR